MLRILSLGAGVQSSTLLLMADRGEFAERPDVAIFADTGWEPRAVYDYLAWLEANVTTIPIERVSAGNIRDDVVLRGKVDIPVFVESNALGRSHAGRVGQLKRQCTYNYKVVPIRRRVRELLGARPRTVIRGQPAEQWFGISLDESERMRDNRDRWIINRYPLIERRMRRSDCLTWLAANGYPTPPKSACIGCPFKGDRQWRHLRDNSPAEWIEVVAFDAAIRSGLRRVQNGTAYLHRSMKPLAMVDLSTPQERGQLEFDLFGAECSGHCGV